MVKSLKWENLEDRRKSARPSMLFKIQHDLIDIDGQQHLFYGFDLFLVRWISNC
jgi:hypothetical protein